MNSIFLRYCGPVLACWSLAGMVAVMASTEEAGELTALLADIETLRADVRQVITEADGDVLEESRIRFLLKRPGGFYWETREPWPELIVTDGKTLWHYQPDLWQLTIDDWQQDESELAAQLLSGHIGRLTDKYRIERDPAPTGAQQVFTLQPLDPGSMYEQLQLHFKDGILDAIEVDQTNGQQTLWEFSGTEVNRPVDDGRFRFELPGDVDRDMLDILDEREVSTGS